MHVKTNIENDLLSDIPIIVTTCSAAQSRGLKDINFDKVIIDEATQGNEIDVLSTMMNAEQVVLIGDPKQLGPVYKFDVPNNDSMLTRLFTAGYKNLKMLQTQYRMHPFLLKVPNDLYYENKIENGYIITNENKFINKD